MIQKVSELKEPPVIGKFYLVPCVLMGKQWTPIVGPSHADPDLLPGLHGERGIHWHRDLRFVSRNQFGPGDVVYEFPDYLPQRSFELRKRKCVRAMPEFPDVRKKDFSAASLWQSLHKRYEGRKVLCGKCPHRGMPLDSLPQDEQGNVICNGHGLKVSMRSQEVVKR